MKNIMSEKIIGEIVMVLTTVAWCFICYRLSKKDKLKSLNDKSILILILSAVYFCMATSFVCIYGKESCSVNGFLCVQCISASIGVGIFMLSPFIDKKI